MPIFQLDDAPRHLSMNVRDCLEKNSPERWIGRDGLVGCQASSPDLTLYDSFIDHKVYQTKIRSLNELTEKKGRHFDSCHEKCWISLDLISIIVRESH